MSKSTWYNPWSWGSKPATTTTPPAPVAAASPANNQIAVGAKAFELLHKTTAANYWQASAQDSKAIATDLGKITLEVGKSATGGLLLVAQGVGVVSNAISYTTKLVPAAYLNEAGLSGWVISGLSMIGLESVEFLVTAGTYAVQGGLYAFYYHPLVGLGGLTALAVYQDPSSIIKIGSGVLGVAQGAAQGVVDITKLAAHTTMFAALKAQELGEKATQTPEQKELVAQVEKLIAEWRTLNNEKSAPTTTAKLDKNGFVIVPKNETITIVAEDEEEFDFELVTSTAENTAEKPAVPSPVIKPTPIEAQREPMDYSLMFGDFSVYEKEAFSGKNDVVVHSTYSITPMGDEASMLLESIMA